MKETRLFYDPLLAGQLSDEEAQHVVRVLRLNVGDEIALVDGSGGWHTAEITAVGRGRCHYVVTSTTQIHNPWRGHIHIALAPTKLMERTEWFVQKAVEIGVDEVSLLCADHSERRTVKTERLIKTAVSAMKQSQKATLPQVHAMVSSRDFIKSRTTGHRFICHCHDLHDISKPFLLDALRRHEDALVMIGPEGDFSPEEVQTAIDCGYQSVSLGHSRLRTETAALVATHLMQIRNMI